MKAKFVYEAMGDVLKAKSKEDIISSLENTNLDPNELLLKSAKVEFLAGIKKALKIGADVHFGNDLALRYASSDGHLATVEFLLKNGADIHSYNDLSLQWASQKGHLATAEFLLKNGADVRGSALHGASVNGHVDIVDLLLKNRADVHAHDDAALRGAFRNGHKDVVELLLKNGANIHVLNDIKRTKKSINESDNRLKIYKNSDGTYDAIIDSVIYNFLWSLRTYKVFNFKKIGKISDKYTFNGVLVKNPHIQMILQIQKKGRINELMSDIFKPKDLKGFHKEFYNATEDLKSVGFKVVGTDTKNIDKGYSNIEYTTEQYPHYRCDIYHINKSVPVVSSFIEEFEKEGWTATFYRGTGLKADNFNEKSWQNLFILILKKLYKQENPDNNIDNLISHAETDTKTYQTEINQLEKSINYFNIIKNILNEKN